MLVVTEIEEYMVTLKHNGRGVPLEIPRQYFPNDIQIGDVVKVIKNEVATRRRNNNI